MNTPTIDLTPSALEQFKNNLGTDIDHKAIYLALKKTGCSGFSYNLQIVEHAQNAEVFDFEGLKMYVDKEALTYLQGTQIDYAKEGFNSTFKFINPNERDRCGCGASFRVK